MCVQVDGHWKLWIKIIQVEKIVQIRTQLQDGQST